MEEAEQSRYVAQLKAEFDSCDTTSTGFLDRDELTALCRKLQLDAHLPLLMDTLLRGRSYTRVNFEEFKDGFVDVLSRSLDLSTSEDDSSYLEPVLPEEVKPKFVRGAKRYGRRSHPDGKSGAVLTRDSDDSPTSRTEATDSSPACKLRRSTSLESVESLKDEEAEFTPRGPQQQEVMDSSRVQEVWEELVGGGGLLAAVCDHLGLQQLSAQELEVLLRKLDADLDGRVSLREFQKVLCGSAPISCSTPVRPHKERAQAVLEERPARSTSPSLLTATVGQRLLSRLDDGSGCTGAEQVVSLWTEEGIRNSRDILQALDFPLEERLSLVDLTLALDNELLVSGSGIQQAALISYKSELKHLQVLAEQACRERDKVKADLDRAQQRNLQLVREVDDRHASMETLNQSRIRDLEQEFRDRLAVLRCQSEQESEVLLQQVDLERSQLQDQLQLLRAQEAELQEELCSTAQEHRVVEEELSAVKLKLNEAESSVNKLQRDLDQLLHHKFGSLDPDGAALSHEERLAQVVNQYQQQCRELRDRNDELSSELLKNQNSHRKSRRSPGCEGAQLVWSESDSDDPNMQRDSAHVRKKLQPSDKTGLDSLDGGSGPTVSIETELALEQLRQKHNQDLQQLHIKLETQVNYYERNLDLMRQNMEVERKDISQAFKLEISELEEQKAQAEDQVKQLKQSLIQHRGGGGGGGGGGWGSEQERRMQRERMEQEQNFAREISNLVQRLSAEKDQLEAELKLKMDQEVMLVREEADQQLSQMKLQHAEGQRRLLHLLHLERQQLQEQRACWESRPVRMEQEKLQREERAREELTSEKKKLEEQHEDELEARSQEVREHSGCLEEDLKASQERCCELETRLQEACSQLEESIGVLEAHEAATNQLTSEKNLLEEELEGLKVREQQLLFQVSQQKGELDHLQVESHSLLLDKEVVADNCSRLSSAFVQLQVQLRARELSLSALRSELENLQETLRAKGECVSRLSAELDSLKTDRARLIQDLKDQAMAVDNLQLELDGATEELGRRRRAEEGLLETLKQEQSHSTQLQSCLDEEKEEVCRLSLENGSYLRLADQLSTQIVEMEEEISTLREHIGDLSAQLNETADLVLDLRRQLNSKSSAAERLRVEAADATGLLRRAEDSSEKHCRQVQQLSVQLQTRDQELSRVRGGAEDRTAWLQQALRDTQSQLRRAEEDYEREKGQMKEQLMDMERLVLALEEDMDPLALHRTQLEEVRSENGALKERLSLLQQEVHSLEDDVANKRKKMEELDGEHEQSREEEERLHKENSKYREEVLDLSSRNLQLSNDNADLNARLHGEQESVRMLQEQLTSVCKDQEEGGAMVRQLQDAAMQQEREKLQKQGAWHQEHHLLEKELNNSKEKLGRLSELEAELSGVALKQQWLEDDKAKLLKEADQRNQKVEKLQEALLSVEAEAELLRSQLHAVNQEKLGHAHEVTDLQRKLQEAQEKVEELESSLLRLSREKEQLSQAQQEQRDQISISLQEETFRLRAQNQELHRRLSELQVQSSDVQRLTQEQQNLKTKLSELETARTQAQDQAVKADSALSLAQAQRIRQLQELQEQAGLREQLGQLQARLVEEQRRSRQLEEKLKLQSQQSSSHLNIKQDQYEKAMSSVEQRTEELEIKLKGVRLLLQEKVQQLREQLARNAKSSALLKDVYVENSQLMKALQVTEQRQKSAEKKNFLLEEKIHALNKLLRDIVPSSLAT
ncbi:ninein-like protein isoform X2 [Genypterus blacodes]|uniref:ninein-like protein isoform X2 n=1 Tax=Genypterus blacodes TaxID=154954 RepID=UPI003F76A7FA